MANKNPVHTLLKYYHTIKYLKWIQIRYRIYYFLRKKWRQLSGYRLPVPNQIPEVRDIKLLESIGAETTWLGANIFSFLNREKDFEKSIDWNFSSYGKLWTYNLNYFEFLHQQNMSKEEGLRLINEHIDSQELIQDGLEPFPISLRSFNWIKFLRKHEIVDEKINRALYHQLLLLCDNLEYHLLGNHLLENGFALLHGGVYFNDASLRRQAESILTSQLKEQILADGGHFERSPMYHQLMLFRVLDGVNLLQQHKKEKEAPLLSLLRNTAERMMGWMQTMTLSNGEVPMFHDSAAGIAPTSVDLLAYGKRLGLVPNATPLKESGYRKFCNSEYELIADVEGIKADYIPGHAHSGLLGFVLQVNDQPFITDTGISTFEKNCRRQLERSTASHNTVQLGDHEQSEIWGGFRVARRAKGVVLEESSKELTATHDGYARFGGTHIRSWHFDENSIQITDKTSGGKGNIWKAYFHFHPTINLKQHASTIKADLWNLTFSGAESLDLKEYDFAEGYNKRRKAKKLVIKFTDTLQTTIHQ